MPPASKKDCSVILFDLATQNREKALQTLLKITCLNHFSETKDLTKLVLLNSDATENQLNARHGGYEHINEVTKECMIYHPRIQMDMIEQSGTGEANWLEGLLVAVKTLEEEYTPLAGVITLQLLFITDLSSPLTNRDQNLVDEIVEEINKLGVFLYIVGPDVPVPFTIKNPEDIRTWMADLQVDQNNTNLKIAKEIVTNTKHSVICNFKVGVHLFFSLRNWGGTQPWQVPLSVGSKVKIPAQTLKILDEGMPCKLATLNRFGNFIWVDAEDESEEIQHDKVRSGISRHGKFVIIEDNKMFQVENPRSFDILCFTSSFNVPEYLMRGGGCYCVLPNGSEKQNEAMTTLIDCLSRQNKYIIARRVYNANFVPKIVVLVPKPDHNPKCFFLTGLPYGEDVRFNYSEKKPEAAPKTDVVDEVYKFLDTLNAAEGDNEWKPPLDVTMMVDHNSQKLINKCCDKLFEKYKRLEELDIDYIAEATPGGESLKSVWVERQIHEEKKKKEGQGDEESDEDFEW